MASAVNSLLPHSTAETALAPAGIGQWIRSVFAITLEDVGNRCKHLIQHFTRPHYRLDKEGIANAQLGLYLAKNHYVRARLESCEVCKKGLLLIH